MDTRTLFGSQHGQLIVAKKLDARHTKECSHDPAAATVAWRQFLQQLDQDAFHIEPSTVANLGADASLPRLLDLMQAGANARQETAGSSP